MDRRSFLLGTAMLASQLLTGCGNDKNKLSGIVLKGSIPNQIVNQFHKVQQTVDLDFAPVSQLLDIYNLLQTWQQKTPPKNKQWSFPRIPLPFVKSPPATATEVVTLGDYWLQSAIEQKLIQPLDFSKLPSWSKLPPRWQELVTRNDQGLLDKSGKVWAAPYRWGSTMIVYNQDKFRNLGWQPTDWSDLWRPELQSRLSLIAEAREVIGLTLKKLGKSYNTENLEIPNLTSELRTLNRQVKFYSSTNYLEPLVIGDTWLAVGWSNDILPILSRYPFLTAVIPKSGTALWADMWVNPVKLGSKTRSQQWIDFCWQPDIAKEIAILTKSNSPIDIKLTQADYPEQLRLLANHAEVFAKSEFLLPLPTAVTQKYESLFKTL